MSVAAIYAPVVVGYDSTLRFHPRRLTNKYRGYEKHERVHQISNDERPATPKPVDEEDAEYLGD